MSTIEEHKQSQKRIHLSNTEEEWIPLTWIESIKVWVLILFGQGCWGALIWILW